MAGEDEVDSPPLLSKCLDFCQALASQGHAFNFSVAIGPSFTFSLDTRSKAVSQVVAKKKPSPSTLRRNAKRREEFIAKKQLKPSPRISSEIKCDQCEYVAASEKGLRQHIRMKPSWMPAGRSPWMPAGRSPLHLLECAVETTVTWSSRGGSAVKRPSYCAGQNLQ